jgi:nitroimidazol reductase NimA-like FMN-containing flavoprotein (pyridoxamine 5'-phosphate oxidase superfamily)
MSAPGRSSTHGDHGGKQPAPAAEHVVSTPHAAPRIVELSVETCHALLRRHHVGRMAYAFHNRVDITPIHYVYADGWLFARTSHVGKMDVLAHAPWVAFEVDEIESVFDWRSVVVHGTAHTMEREGSPLDAEHWSRGIEALRDVVPATGTADDPVPYRTLVFGIFVESVSGRASSTRR